jgi:hypothetical protein
MLADFLLTLLASPRKFQALRKNSKPIKLEVISQIPKLSQKFTSDEIY